VLDSVKLATVHLDYQSDESTLDNDERFWSVECFGKLSKVAPELCLDAVITCLQLLSTPHQAGMLAAGPLEDVIANHGATVIDRIETLARRSPRFRYLLTGVWSQGNDASPIWARRQSAGRPTPYG
jgi:hypothetical protein